MVSGHLGKMVWPTGLVGSNPTYSAPACIAQWIERPSPKGKAEGSNPFAGTES